MGGTAVAPGFKWKPAEPQPMGMFQKECWNTYRVLQEQLGWNTHRETQPVYERGEALHNNSLLLGAVIGISSAGISWEFSRCPALPAVRMALKCEDNRPMVGESEGQPGVQKQPNQRSPGFTPWTLLLRNLREDGLGTGGVLSPFYVREETAQRWVILAEWGENCAPGKK